MLFIFADRWEDIEIQLLNMYQIPTLPKSITILVFGL